MIFVWASSAVIGWFGSAQCRKRLGWGLPFSIRDSRESVWAKATEARLCSVSWPGSALGFPASGRCHKHHRWVMSSLFTPDNLHRSNCFIHMNLPRGIKICCSKPRDWTASDLYFTMWWIFIGDVLIFMLWYEATIDLAGGLLLCCL